jgi:hypothetical protein
LRRSLTTAGGRGGFRSAVGEHLTTGKPPDEGEVTVGVIKLASTAGRTPGARLDTRSRTTPAVLHGCIFDPARTCDRRGSDRDGRPASPKLRGAAGGGGQPPPTHYLVEFTEGPYLYFANTDGSRRDARNWSPRRGSTTPTFESFPVDAAVRTWERERPYSNPRPPT